MSQLVKLVFGKTGTKYLFFGSLIGFIALVALVVLLPPSRMDRWFSLEVQEHSNAFFDAFMKGVSIVGYMQYTLPTVAIVSFVFLLAKMKKEALFILLTLVSGLVSSVVKYLVNRPRPTKDLVRIIEITRQQSFPSGHVLFYTVFFGFLVFLMYRLRQIPVGLRLSVATLSLLMIVLVSISRIYLGAHWLTDIIGGYLLGIVCLYGLVNLYLGEFEWFNDLRKS